MAKSSGMIREINASLKEGASYECNSSLKTQLSCGVRYKVNDRDCVLA
jgi:hypothetical protein